MNRQPLARCARRVAGTVILAALGCRGDGDEARAARPVPPASPPGVVTLDERARQFTNLQFAAARPVAVADVVRTTGTLAWDPAAVSEVATPVRGRLLELHGSVGDRVAAGTIVAVVENPDNLSGRFDVHAVRGGVITDRAASVGQVVEAGARLLRVVDDGHLWLLVDIPPAGERPRVGSAVRAHIPAAGAEVVGTISAILPQADSISHVAHGRVVIANARRQLAAGMSALVTADVGERRQAVAVPRAAVVLVGGRSVVFVPEGAGFRAVRVETGAPVGRDEVAILSGLAAGERVVTVGAQQLANASFNFKGLGEDEEDDEGQP